MLHLTILVIVNLKLVSELGLLGRLPRREENTLCRQALFSLPLLRQIDRPALNLLPVIRLEVSSPIPYYLHAAYLLPKIIL